MEKKIKNKAIFVGKMIPILILIASIIVFILAMVSIDNDRKSGLSLSAPEITATTTNNTVHIKWSPVSGAHSYRIYRYMNGKIEVIGVTPYTINVYTDKISLVGNTHYWYAVKAVNKSSEETQLSEYSNKIHYCKSISAPQNVTATKNEDNTVLVNWEENPCATSYRVYRTENHVNMHVIGVVAKGQTSITDSEVKGDIIYNYRVKAVNSSTGETILSEYSNKSTPVVLSIDAPQNVIATKNENNTVSVKWEENPCATAYRVYRTENYVNMHVIGVVAKGQTSIIDSEVKGDTIYNYRVKAVNTSMGETILSEYSDKTIAIVLSINAPQNVVVTKNANNTVLVNWEENPCATSYRVYRTENNVNRSLIGVVAKGVTYFVDESIKEEGVSYNYYVKVANSSSGEILTSEYSNKSNTIKIDNN